MLYKYIPVFLCFYPSTCYAFDLPQWAKDHSLKANDVYVYSVGSASSKDINEAMAKAWDAAVIGIVRANIPDAVSIQEKVRETLKGGDYSRSSSTKISALSLKGLEEDSSQKSPRIVANISGEAVTYTVYRLFRWERTKITDASTAVVPKDKTPGEAEFNRLTSYFKQIKCGITLEELEEEIGEGNIEGKDGSLYFSRSYGIYKVTILSNKHMVSSISKNGRLFRSICR